MTNPVPDIETVVATTLILARSGGFPVKCCAAKPHQHKGVACPSPGKRPLDPAWQAADVNRNLSDFADWLDEGYTVGVGLSGRLIGLDADVTDGLERFFARVNEPVPVSMGDVVPATGKRHLYVEAPYDLDDRDVIGTFSDGNGVKLGEVARKGARQFIVPGSPWVSPDGSVSDTRVWNEVEQVATLSEAAMSLLLRGSNGAAHLSVVSAGGDWTWDVDMGSRHVLLLNESRRLAGSIRDAHDLAEMVWKWGQRHGLTGPHPETGRAITPDEVLDMCITGIAKFDEDPAPITLLVPRAEELRAQQAPVVIPESGLFINVRDYHAAAPKVIDWVSPLAAYGTVSLVSGLPKSGKSTLISNLLAARESNAVFLWGDPVPTGPMVLVSEEGGFPVVRKTHGLTTLDILDRLAFVVAGLRSLDHLLAALTTWVDHQPGPALVIIDTLAVWGDIKDENDAIAATNAIVALRVWAQHHGAAVVLVHHTRKGGGDYGEAVRGSGGIVAAVDTSIELSRPAGVRDDKRSLDIIGRLDYGVTRTLDYDRSTGEYRVSNELPVEKYPTDQFPLDGSGAAGFTNVEAGQVWGMAPNSANRRLKELCDAGVLVARQEQAAGSRAKHLAYWKARPLLVVDARSVSEQMADIFASDERDD